MVKKQLTYAQRQRANDTVMLPFKTKAIKPRDFLNAELLKKLKASPEERKKQ